MSYRNDHEAALYRVTSLENELAQLRKGQDKPATPPRRKRNRRFQAILMSLMAAGAVAALATVMHLGTTADAAPQPAVPALVAPADTALASIRTCIDKIEAPGRVLDASSTDPRSRFSESVAGLGRTGAACRAELATLVNSNTIDGKQLRDRVSRWSLTEDVLANSISLVSVYYAGDPIALDHYATAAQLWTEYHRALTERDAALEPLRGTL